MTDQVLTFRNGRIFDGTHLLDGCVARFENGQFAHLGPEIGECPPVLVLLDQTASDTAGWYHAISYDANVAESSRVSIDGDAVAMLVDEYRVAAVSLTRVLAPVIASRNARRVCCVERVRAAHCSSRYRCFRHGRVSRSLWSH